MNTTAAKIGAGDWEKIARAGWERGRNGWCPAGILADHARTERDWQKARIEIAATLQADLSANAQEGFRMDLAHIVAAGS